MMKKSISEILKEVETYPAQVDKIEFLRKNDSHVLRTILQCAFDPAIKFLLPEGVPAGYKPEPFGDAQNMLYARCRELYLYIEGGHKTLDQEKREKLFLAFLMSIDAEDAQLMCAVKDKHIPYRGVTPELVSMAFPGLLSVVNIPKEEDEDYGIGKPVTVGEVLEVLSHPEGNNLIMNIIKDEAIDVINQHVKTVLPEEEAVEFMNQKIETEITETVNNTVDKEPLPKVKRKYTKQAKKERTIPNRNEQV